MSGQRTGFMSGLVEVTFTLYIIFVAIPGTFILMPLDLGWPEYLTLACLLVGGPMIVNVLFDQSRYVIALMATIVMVFIAIGYVNRVDVPDAEPDKGSEFARKWLDHYRSDPDAALDAFHDENGNVLRFEREIWRVDLTELSFERVQEFAPSTSERRGSCNIYHVWFTHPQGKIRVGVGHCYDGGPEFEVRNVTLKENPPDTTAQE